MFSVVSGVGFFFVLAYDYGFEAFCLAPEAISSAECEHAYVVFSWL